MPRRALVLALAPAVVLSLALPLAQPAAALATTYSAGVDLSHWQHDAGPLDWPTVHAGESFAVAKATDGTTFTDPTYADNVAQARGQGMVVGSYHYAEPQLPMSSAVAQADFYATTIGSVQQPNTLPPILDLETPGTLTSPAQLVTWAQTFLDEVMARTGRTPVVYTGRQFWTSKLNNSAAFSRFPLWISDPSAAATGPTMVGGWTGWSLWQWTTGTVAGFTGQVDEDRFNGDATALAAFANGTLPTVLPAVAPQPPIAVTAAIDPSGLEVAWQPGDDGGRPVTSYTVTVQPGGATLTVAGTETSAVLTGLDPAGAYTASVVASSAVGPSAASVASTATTPVGSVSLSPGTTTTVQAGHTAVLTGTATRAAQLGGLATVPLVLWAKTAGAAAFVPVQTIVTSATGSYTVAVKVSATTRYCVRLSSGAGWPDASASTLLTAQAAIRAALDHRSIARGAVVTIAGAVSAAAAGRLVYRQRWYADAWHTGPAARVSKTGHFTFRVAGATRGTSKLRVILPSTPALHGVASATLLLTVR